MIRHYLRPCCFTSLFLICIVFTSCSAPSIIAQSPCGTWQANVNIQDQRMQPNVFIPGSDASCHGAVRLSNNTGLPLIGGGYTLEVEAYSVQNASFYWQPSFIAHGNQNSMADLLPSVNIELHSVPNVGASNARIGIRGNMTLRSWTVDTSLFLLRTALVIEPTGLSCLIPQEQLVFTAIRVSSIVEGTTQLASAGDMISARQEFSQVADEFFTKAAESLQEVGIGCAFDALEKVVGKPILIAKVGVALLTWAPVEIYDYFKYQGQPVEVSFEFTAGAGNGQVKAFSPTYSQIISKNSGMCLDIQNEAMFNGAHVWQVGCNGKDNQLWDLRQRGNYYEIVVKHSGKCMTPEGGTPGDGINIVQSDCVGGSDQLWEVQSAGFNYFQLRAQPSGRCMDLAMAGKQPGDYLIEWPCNGGDNQLWQRR